MDNDNIECTELEHTSRLNYCKNCIAFKIKDDFLTECSECGCSISLMTTFKFKICPKGNWE